MARILFKHGNYRIVPYHMDSLYMVQWFDGTKWCNIIGNQYLQLAISDIKKMEYKDTKSKKQ